MSLIIEKCIKGGICLHENKESSYSKYWDVNNLHGSAMPQKLPVYDFKWVEDVCEFDEGFIKSCNEESDKEYFTEVDIQYLENLPSKNLTFKP